jgi:hypothetical protein
MRSPEWLIERGIGETRAAMLEDGRILEARITVDGIVPAGTILAAQMMCTGRNSVALADGQEYLLPRGAPGITQGAKLNIEVTREALGGLEPWKRPLARQTDAEPRSAPALEGRKLQFPSGSDELEAAGWSDLLDEARSGLVAFAGGELRVSVTPAMTLIDVDGSLPSTELAVAGARAAARAIRRHGIGGSIGVDLPTMASKAGRQAAAETVDQFLPKPFERTAVNGFGFLQIVRPRFRASLFELASNRAPFEAAALLRRAGREIGSIRLVAHPAVVAVLTQRQDWLDQLAKQVGGAVTLRAEPSIAMSAGHAEKP